MPGTLNQLVGSHQLIPATWTLNINLWALVLFYVVSRYISFANGAFRSFCSWILPIRRAELKFGGRRNLSVH